MKNWIFLALMGVGVPAVALAQTQETVAVETDEVIVETAEEAEVLLDEVVETAEEELVEDVEADAPMEPVEAEVVGIEPEATTDVAPAGAEAPTEETPVEVTDEAQPVEMSEEPAPAPELADEMSDDTIADVIEDGAEGETVTEEETETAGVDDAEPTEMVEDVSAEETTEVAPDTTTEEAAAEPVAAEDAAPSDAAEEVAEVIEPEPEPEPDPREIAAATCLEIAGPADAGVPAKAVDAASQKATLSKAAAYCTEAATMEGADPEVLFHAAAIAQTRGNATETFDLLTRAEEMGLGPAATRLGDYFLFGVGPQGQDINLAVEHYRKAVELGSPAGMTTLALLYQVGQGVPVDATRMLELLTEAADSGYHFAQYRLAQTLYRGDGVPGRADAALGIPDPDRAVGYYQKAAMAGNLSAALELSELYADPNSGLPDNPEEQLRLTSLVAREGHPASIARMGVFYETGRGVAYAPETAAGLYVRAMETGKVAFEDLRRGAPGQWDRETALAFQRILQERGLYRGPLDAIVGGGTAAGARALAAQ